MLLNLPGFTVLRTEDVGDDKCVVVETDQVPTTCPKCQNLFAEFYSHGSRTQFFHDAPFHGKRVALKIDRKRFKCRECNGTFEEPLAVMHPDHNMTKRLAEFITKECYRDKFTDVARRSGVTEKTVRNVFREHVDTLRTKYRFETPEVLGIDEINIRQMRCVITNLSEKSIIDMLPTRTKDEVTGFLLSMDRKAVKLVSIDMWLPYRDACALAFPQAHVVIDRFHVQKMANEIMTRVRVNTIRDMPKAQRKNIKNGKFILLSRNFNLTDYQQDVLLGWCKLSPVLGDVYQYKERFMDIWDADSREEAERKYDAWKLSLPSDLKVHFKQITTAFKNWRKEIFNWWDHKITNAFTESLNGKIRELHMSGRGYSFEVLRAKILSKANLHKVKAIPVKFNKNVFAYSRMTMETGTPNCTYINYGIDISKLLEISITDLD